VLIAVIILALIAYVLWKTPYHRIYIKLHMALIFIAGGAIGNLIDRIRLDYVVDFFYFSLINFPIFNVADIYVTFSAVALVILLLFVYKEADLEFLSFRTKKFRDVK
jgi:signal peptidase II